MLRRCDAPSTDLAAWSAEIFSNFTVWPDSFDPRAYVEGWSALKVSFTRFFLNSALVASAAVIVANGGELEAKEFVAERGVVQRRYWVPTDS